MSNRLTLATCLALMIVAGVAHSQEPGAQVTATLAVLNKSDGTVSLVDTASREVRKTIAVGRGPHEAATSPDGGTVVVCNYGDRRSLGNSLSVIDVATAKVTRTIELGKFQNPHGIVFLKDGRRVVVTAERQKALLIVDVVKGEVLKAMETRQRISHMVAVTPDEKRAFVANIGSGSVSVLDLEKGECVDVVPTGDGAEGVAVSPDGREVWVTNRGADTVSVLDAKTMKVEATIPAAAFPIRVAFTPGGRHTLVSCAKSNDILVVDAAKRLPLRRISTATAGDQAADGDDRVFGSGMKGAVPVGILIPPHGRVAYVANTYADAVSIVDLRTWKITGRIVAGKEPDGLAWSPVRLRP